MLGYKAYARSGEDFARDCKSYFELCDSENASGKLKKPYTVSGLCLFLGISRAELQKLSYKRTHVATVKETMLKIESFIEENALLGALANTPALYCLKYNFGWSDKQTGRESEDTSKKFSLDAESDKWAN